MRKLILLLGLVLQVIIVDAQSVSGSLVDEQGIFSIDQTSGNNILRISCLGFIPVTKAYAQFPVTIVMHEDV